MTNWPDYIEEDDFADVLYSEEEAEALLRVQLLEFQLAAMKASEGLKRMARAAKVCGESIGRVRDDYVLSRDEVMEAE